MRTINIDIGSASGWVTICAGRRGEKETTQVVFDISSLIETYGAGTAVFFNKRNTDETAYPVVVDQSGNLVTWTVSDTDTNVVGSGRCELWYYVGESLAKTLVFQTYIAEDIGVPGDPPPEPFENWVEQLTDLGAETLANAQAAEDAKDDAIEAKEAAEAAAHSIVDLTVSSETLPAGSSATVTKTESGGVYNLDFGIPKGDKGDKGDTGATGATPDIYTTATTLPAGSSAYAHVSGTIEQPLITFGIPKGDKGDKGDTGTAATVSVGTTTTGAAGSSASVTNSGSTSAAVFNFTIPKGDTGATGADGADGISPEVTIGTITGGHSVTITDADHPTGQTFNVLDGTNTDAEHVTYDSTQTFSTGTVGNALNHLNSDITDLTNNKADIITDTASGAIASFPDGAALPIKSLTAAINPVQSGTGDPAPDNIRPISGWTGANVTGTGKNLFGGDALKDGVTNSVPSAVVDTTNKTVSFTNSATTQGSMTRGRIRFKDNTRYVFVATVSKNSVANTLNMRIKYTDGTYTNLTGLSATDTKERVWTISTAGKTVDNLQKFNGGGTTTLYYEESGIFEYTGSWASSDFAPYEGTTYPITFPDSAGAVYGGTLTVNEDGSGVLTVDKEKKVFDGTESLSLRTGENPYIAYKIGSYGTIIRAEGISSHLVRDSVSQTNTNIAVNPANSSGYNGAFINMRFDPQLVPTTVADYQAYFAQQYANGTPFEVVYYLSSPITYDLTAEEVGGILTTLKGENNVWADTGDVSLEYRADTKLYLEKLTAPTEDDLVADHAIASGTFFMIGNQLFKATAAIANGANITIGTNATQLSLADALNLINA